MMKANKFSSQPQQQFYTQQQQIQMLRQAQAQGLTMEELYGDEDQYYDEEYDGSIDPQQMQ